MTVNDNLSLPKLVIFSTPNLAVGVMITALSVVIPAFYAKYTEASLAAIGTALFTVRLIESIMDPIAGYLSDRTRSKLGPRKPWMLVGGLLIPFSVYFLFNPSADVGALYFFVWYQLLLLTSWAAIIIPHRAWATELSRDYTERARIFTSLGVAYGLGAVVFAIIPFTPLSDTTELSPVNMSYVGWFLMGAFPIFVFTSTIFIPQGKTDYTKASGIKLSEYIKAIAENRPFQWFLSAFIIGGVGQGIVLACIPFYIDVYLGLGRYFALVLLIVYVVAITTMPVWLQCIKAIGKHRSWAIGWGGAALLGLAMFLVPREGAGLPMLLMLIGLYGTCSAVESFIPNSVLGDVIDYDTLKTGVNRAGLFNALMAFGAKFNMAIGGAIGFYLLDFFDFKVTGVANSRESELGFVFTFIVLPTFLYACSAMLIWRCPIDKKRHSIIQKRLQQLELRAVS